MAFDVYIFIVFYPFKRVVRKNFQTFRTFRLGFYGKIPQIIPELLFAMASLF